MIKSELGWTMCWADVVRLQSVVLTPAHELDSPPCDGYGGYNGRFGIYGELHRLPQTSAPPPSAASKVQQSVYTWGWLHGSRKSVCVQVHAYSHMHICTGVWSEGLLIWPTWLEPNSSNTESKWRKQKICEIPRFWCLTFFPPERRHSWRLDGFHLKQVPLAPLFENGLPVSLCQAIPVMMIISVCSDCIN